MDSPNVKYQIKVMNANNAATQLNFNNLVVGKIYKLTAGYSYGPIGNSLVVLVASHNGVEILRLHNQNNAGVNGRGSADKLSADTTFVATATTVTFVASGTTMFGDAGAEPLTYSMLEELNNHTLVT